MLTGRMICHIVGFCHGLAKLSTVTINITTLEANFISTVISLGTQLSQPCITSVSTKDNHGHSGTLIECLYDLGCTFYCLQKPLCNHRTELLLK